MGRGTGLGLASVYGVMKNHGGHIEVKSKKGQGVVFYLHLPTDDKMVTSVREDCEGEVGGPGSETILIVDDEAMQTDIVRKLLEKMGYRVFTANSGDEAVSLYGERREGLDWSSST